MTKLLQDEAIYANHRCQLFAVMSWRRGVMGPSLLPLLQVIASCVLHPDDQYYRPAAPAAANTPPPPPPSSP